ncbi:MAG: hypothetical protein JKY52_09215 [Flavobacteriales bacterium]|nr:hypothetical protein [Flavobacteriales bacterium]
MRKTKVCDKPLCKVSGARQNIDNFKMLNESKAWYSNTCKSCVSAAHNSLIHGQSVEVLGNDRYLVNHFKYKIGRFNFLFYFVDGGWIKSENDVDWLMRKVRRYAQA